MKTIRIANGIKIVDLSCNVFSAIAEIRNLLKEHRQVLIDQVLVDLPTYILDQYDAQPTGDQLSNIKDRLQALRAGDISTFRYDSVIDDILDHDVVSIKSEPFYFEINEAINAEMNTMQLLLTR